MKYYPYPKRDAIKNYFPLPNKIYCLNLSAGAIAVYGYLLYIEDRKTYQAQAGYKTISKAVKMSANTVAKYVGELEEKQLVRTETTTIIMDGCKCNGTLLYHIRPIREVVDYYYEQQLQKLDADVERQRVEAQLSRLCALQEPLTTTEQPRTPSTP